MHTGGKRCTPRYDCPLKPGPREAQTSLACKGGSPAGAVESGNLLVTLAWTSRSWLVEEFPVLLFGLGWDVFMYCESSK